MKNIVLSLTYGMSIRDLISKEFLKNLGKKNKLILISSLNEKKNSEYLKKLGFHEIYTYKKNSIFEQRIIYIVSLLKTLKTIDKNLTLETILKSIEGGKAEPIIQSKYRFLSFSICKIIKKISILNNFLIIFFQLILYLCSLKYLSILRKMKPDLYFASSPFNYESLLFDYIISFFNVRKICHIHSWDNITTALRMHLKYEKVIVWNKVMQKELIKYYNYTKKNIFVSGIPQFDFYFIKDIKSKSKSFFFKKNKIKINPKKKIVLLFAPCPSICSHFDEIIIKMIENMDKHKILNKINLIIRTHPGFDKDYFKLRKKTKKFNNIFYNFPTATYLPLPTNKIGDIYKDQLFFYNLLNFSDVTINFFSTTSLDAAVLNKPIIGMSIERNGIKSTEAASQYSFYYKWIHYKKLMQLNGISLSKNYNEFIKFLNYYLKNPSYKKRERKNISKLYLDDKTNAKKQISDFIIKNL